MRMTKLRFARLSNGFSKKLGNYVAALSLDFMYYNFCCVHKALRVTPAIEAGVFVPVWSIKDVVELLGGARERFAA